MDSMFHNARAFEGNVSSFDTSRVTNMDRMFRDAVLFNSPGVVGWNVESLTSCNFIFLRARSFNQDLSDWQVGQVRNMVDMFFGCIVFSQNLCTWGPLLAGDDSVATGLLIFGNTACPNDNFSIRSATPPGPYCFVCTITPTR
jgi:surface protein